MELFLWSLVSALSGMDRNLLTIPQESGVTLQSWCDGHGIPGNFQLQDDLGQRQKTHYFQGIHTLTWLEVSVSGNSSGQGCDSRASADFQTPGGLNMEF